MNQFMDLAKEKAILGYERQEGGPFGAIIVDSKGNIIAEGNDQVYKRKDPTAHAEIIAIREACQKLNTYNLSGYTLYTSCEPCTMCLSAIICANIIEVYYGCTKEDAKKIGFCDKAIYEFLKGKNKKIIELKQMDRFGCKKIMEKYTHEKIIYEES